MELRIVMLVIRTLAADGNVTWDSGINVERASSVTVLSNTLHGRPRVIETYLPGHCMVSLVHAANKHVFQSFLPEH